MMLDYLKNSDLPNTFLSNNSTSIISSIDLGGVLPSVSSSYLTSHHHVSLWSRSEHSPLVPGQDDGVPPDVVMHRDHGHPEPGDQQPLASHLPLLTSGSGITAKSG